MTLVARTKHYSAPTMMGDLLLTAKNTFGSIILPAIGKDISNLMSEIEYRPIGLAQKLYILNDKVCIAFAGDVSEIRDLLEDFRIYFSVPNLSPKDVLEFTKKYDYSKFRESAYFMMVLDEKEGDDVEVLEISYGHFSKQMTEFFNETSTTGSGAGDFESIVNEERRFESSFENDDPRQAIVKSCSLIPRLLVEERYFLHPLQNQWGGGYEVAFYNGSKLEKLNNIAFLLQSGTYNDKGLATINLPIMVNHYRYMGEDLIITAVEFHNAATIEEGDFVIIKSNNLRTGSLCIPPILRGRSCDLDVRASQSFETCSIGMGFAIDRPSQMPFKPSSYFGTRAIQIAFNKDERTLEIRMHKDAREFINQMLKLGFSPPTE